ncbi:MAG: FHA domain-containing protein [Coriobacteriia bacterium]|nr:FHA domain-containing protein [Coriobacteriia bacterium]
MIDVTLLIGRLLLVALLFLFLFAVMRTGIGLVSSQNRKGTHWNIAVEEGPRELRGVRLNVSGPVVVGRSPGADIVIAAEFVSGRHARFCLLGNALTVEDLGSTNGTLVNAGRIEMPVTLEDGDLVSIGDVTLRIRHS